MSYHMLPDLKEDYVRQPDPVEVQIERFDFHELSANRLSSHQVLLPRHFSVATLCPCV